MQLPSVALALAALTAFGCAPAPAGMDAGRDATAGSEAGRDAAHSDRILLGTGQSYFEPIADPGGTIELVFGAQGGYHVWGRVQFKGLHPDVDVSFLAVDVTHGRTLHVPQPQRRWIADGTARGLFPVGADTFATDAELVVLDIRCSDEIVGAELELHGIVRDRVTGEQLEDVRVARVGDDIPSPPCARDR